MKKLIILLLLISSTVLGQTSRTDGLDSTSVRPLQYRWGTIIVGKGADNFWHILRTDDNGYLFATPAAFDTIYSDYCTAGSIRDSVLVFGEECIFVSVAAKESYGYFVGLQDTALIYIPPGCTFTWNQAGIDTVWVRTEEATSVISAIGGKR